MKKGKRKTKKKTIDEFVARVCWLPVWLFALVEVCVDNGSLSYLLTYLFDTFLHLFLLVSLIHVLNFSFMLPFCLFFISIFAFLQLFLLTKQDKTQLLSMVQPSSLFFFWQIQFHFPFQVYIYLLFLLFCWLEFCLFCIYWHLFVKEYFKWNEPWIKF